MNKTAVRDPNRPILGRIDWIDYAKGLSIILVVMMHSTLGVEAAVQSTGWLSALVDFAQPFRMPAFFLVAGLFLSKTISQDWTEYLDRKVLHFIYFYILWLSISFLFKGPALAKAEGIEAVISLFLLSFIEPFGTLWFIYLLPIFFIIAKLLRGQSPAIVFGLAALLEIAPIQTGSTVIDEIASRFVYFYVGYVIAENFFDLASMTAHNRTLATAGVIAALLLNGWCVIKGTSDWPVISLILGLVGSVMMVSLATLLSTTRLFGIIRYCGQQSLIIYLAFFLPMAITRTLMIKLGIISDIGTISLIVTLAAITGPLVLHRLIRYSWANFLFERPKFLHLSRRPKLQAAE